MSRAHFAGLERLMRSAVIELPTIDAVNMQVRTGASVPFAEYMRGRELACEEPQVDAINMQVRTGASVPFAEYMRGKDVPSDQPEVDTINMQVRTGASVPFAEYMRDKSASDQPQVDSINMQVRTGASVPFAEYMQSKDASDQPQIDAINVQVRTGASVPFNPYMLGAHAEELLKKRVMISPVLAVWTYSVANAERFHSWLGRREILLSEQRLGGDDDVKGVRYGGTYRVQGDDKKVTYKTVWGFTSDSARSTLERLANDDCASASLVQIDLIDFVKGLKALAREGGGQVSQEIMVSAAAGSA